MSAFTGRREYMCTVIFLVPLASPWSIHLLRVRLSQGAVCTAQYSRRHGNQLLENTALHTVEVGTPGPLTPCVVVQDLASSPVELL